MPDNKGECWFEKWCRRRRRRRRGRRRDGNEEVPLALPPVCPIAKGRHSWPDQEMAKERQF